ARFFGKDPECPCRRAAEDFISHVLLECQKWANLKQSSPGNCQSKELKDFLKTEFLRRAFVDIFPNELFNVAFPP
ncbi:hypothetical protein AVEN_72951-1, partial [Araneus ventricosus]